jgi:hypothetical protein
MTPGMVVVTPFDSRTYKTASRGASLRGASTHGFSSLPACPWRVWLSDKQPTDLNEMIPSSEWDTWGNAVVETHNGGGGCSR